jgi:hypothetical protein
LQIPAIVSIRHTIAGAKRLQELVQGRHRANRYLGHRDPADQTLRIDEHRLVALRQAKPPLGGGSVRVVNREEAGDGLLLQPLAGVAFARPGTSRELACGRGAALMQGSIEPELVANIDAEDLKGVDHRREYAAGDLIGRGIGRL